MKTRLVSLAAPALALIGLAAWAPPTPAMSISASGDLVRWLDHRDTDDARLAITSENGKITLLLNDREVALQLSDRMVHKVKRELRDKKDEQDTALGHAIVSAVIGTVGEFIDNSLVCRVDDIRDVSYEDGRLRFTSRRGKPIFEDTDLCDGDDEDDVMASFSPSDARRFVREFRRLKAGD